MPYKTQHKYSHCPRCGGKLRSDKHPIVSYNGFIYRKKNCLSCGEIIFTKQPPEEVTGREKEYTQCGVCP